MKGWGIVVILAVAVVVVFAIAFSGVLPHADDAAITGLATNGVATFQGKALQLPDPWREYVPGSRGNVLSMQKAGGSRGGPTMTLEDERRKPENTRLFVDGWLTAAKANPGFHPQSISEDHDVEVDSAGMHCVAIRWPDQRKPLQLVCLASDGRWKLTLMGKDSDVKALDAIAHQMPGFQRGL